MPWTTRNTGLNKTRRKLKNDSGFLFLRAQMHPIRTQRLFKTKKGLTKLANPLNLLAGTTRLELATSGVTGRRSNQN